MIPQPLSLKMQLKVIDRAIKLQKIPAASRFGIYNDVIIYNGICVNVSRAIESIFGYESHWSDLEKYVPKIIRENAYKFGASKSNAYWWSRCDLKSRLNFLYHVKKEIKKDIRKEMITKLLNFLKNKLSWLQ